MPHEYYVRVISDATGTTLSGTSKLTPNLTASVTPSVTSRILTRAKFLNADTRTYNVCDASYVLRPDHERACDGIPIVCHYGACLTTGRRSHCECDIGAVGLLCTKRCCKPCSEHGTCDVLSNNREVCVCDNYYTGEFCEIYDPPAGNFWTEHVFLRVSLV